MKLKRIFTLSAVAIMLGALTVAISTIVAESQAVETDDIGEYPLDANSAEWSQLSSVETAAACNMPKEYAESLTTEELVDYAVNYPFLMDILAFDHIEDGMNHLAKKSYLFEELYSRADCFDELLTEFSELAESDDVSDNYFGPKLFIKLYLEINYDLLSKDQAAKFRSIKMKIYHEN